MMRRAAQRSAAVAAAAAAARPLGLGCEIGSVLSRRAPNSPPRSLMAASARRRFEYCSSLATTATTAGASGGGGGARRRRLLLVAPSRAGRGCRPLVAGISSLPSASAAARFPSRGASDGESTSLPGGAAAAAAAAALLSAGAAVVALRRDLGDAPSPSPSPFAAAACESSPSPSPSPLDDPASPPPPPPSARPHPGASPRPSAAGTDDICDDAPTLDGLPVYRIADVARNDGRGGRPMWMSYGGVVYDVTNFIPNHPGGSEKLVQAAGSAIEPYWNIYRQHYSSDLPMRMMEQMIIGRLHESDQASIDEQMERELDENDPYSDEPIRHPALRVHSDQPMHAELPPELLTERYLTPPELFYVRHHHPVPRLDDDDLEDYSVQVDLTAFGGGLVDFSLDDLRTKFPKAEIVATLQCSGNRRSDFDASDARGRRTTGTQWGQGAISTARWGGARLSDVLAAAGLDDPIGAQEREGEGGGLRHVRFESLDGMTSSIDAQKALSPYGDVILAYEMNGAPLTPDHGFPVRAVVPGYSAVRSVKWVSRIEPSDEEAEGPWQRGLNYKALPPGVTDANAVDLSEMPSVMEASVYSGITEVERVRDASAAGGDGHGTGTALKKKLSRKNSKRAYLSRAEEQERMEEEMREGLRRMRDERAAAAEEGGPAATSPSPSPTPSPTPTPSVAQLRPGDRVQVRASGWAWAGGGRPIVRVDVTGDDGETWTTADVTRGADQRPGRAWAWVFWSAELPAVVGGDGTTVELCSKAVDASFNVQPENCSSCWNVRGLGNNSWYRIRATVA